MVTLADDRVEISECTDVEEALASAEGSDMVTLVSSDTTKEVTAETLTGENIWVISTGVAEKWVAVGCGGKILVDKDIALLSVGPVAKLVSNILMIEATRGSGNVFVLPEVGDGVGFPSDGVSEVHCAVHMWMELKISAVPLYEVLGVVFTDFGESQHPLTSVVAVLLSNGAVNFSKSGKGETVTEAVTICTDSSVASSIVANGEISVVAAIVDLPLR